MPLPIRRKAVIREDESQSSRFVGKGSATPLFHPARSCRRRFRQKSSSHSSGIFTENLAGGGVSHPSPRNRERLFPLKIKDMKTSDPTTRKRMKWIGTAIVAVVAALGFSYLYTRGVSPVWAAVAIVCFPGFFRFIYKIACIVMAALILFAILGFLVF